MSEFFIVENGQQAGPFSIDNLRYKNLTPDSLVWKAGLSEWVKAGQLPELEPLFVQEVIIEPEQVSQQSDNGWYAMFDNVRIGPSSLSELINSGLNPSTPVWHEGFPDWMPASNVPEIMETLNNRPAPNFAQNPQYGPQQPNYAQNPQYGPQQPNYAQNPQYGPQQPNYAQNPQYGPQQPNYAQNPQYGPQQPNNSQYPKFGQQQPNYGNNTQYNPQPNPNGYPSNRSNWLTLSIIATVVGFLFSCIGAIFGIIGIVQANRANNLYNMGYYDMSEQANKTAKTMSIIAFVLAGLGLLYTVFTIGFGSAADKLFNV